MLELQDIRFISLSCVERERERDANQNNALLYDTVLILCLNVGGGTQKLPRRILCGGIVRLKALKVRLIILEFSCPPVPFCSLSFYDVPPFRPNLRRAGVHFSTRTANDYSSRTVRYITVLRTVDD